MTKYYEIMPVRDEYHTIFDTIRYVSESSDTSVGTLLLFMGFRPNETPGGLMAELLQIKDKHAYFGIDQYMADKLNEFCRTVNIPLRITRSYLLRRSLEDERLY